MIREELKIFLDEMPKDTVLFFAGININKLNKEELILALYTIHNTFKNFKKQTLSNRFWIDL